jgi:glycosyltransferase involved in cell wall biosynthesis
MKIVLLAEVSASSVIGGAERVLREHALGLGRRGHEAAIVARMPADDQRPTIRQDGIVEHRFPVSRSHALAFVWSSIGRSVEVFDRVCGSGRADAVVIHQALAGAGPILRRRSAARRWIYACLSLAHEEYLSRAPRTGSWWNRLQLAVNAKVRQWIERLVLRRCDRVIVLSEFMRQRVRAVHRIPEDRIRLIPGAADLVKFRPAGDRAAVRQSLKLPRTKTLLVTVRNLVPRMGLEHLIGAMKELGEEGRDCLLLIGGEGALRSSIERQIREQGLADRVTLLGFILEEDLPKYYQAADLVLMPTHELEGFGLVTVEALACGTPVLGTPVAAIPEVLSRLDPELVAKGTDSRSLATAMQNILRRFREHPDDRARLAAAGRSLVERDYNWEQHTARLERELSG